MPPHILLVEDSTLVIDALRVLLEGQGFRVSAASTVAEATASARADRPDLILLDITLHREDGLTVLTDLARTGDLPRVAIALTGHDAAAVRGRCLEAGCREVLTKPINTRELPVMLRAWLSEC